MDHGMSTMEAWCPRKVPSLYFIYTEIKADVQTQHTGTRVYALV